MSVNDISEMRQVFDGMIKTEVGIKYSVGGGGKATSYEAPVNYRQLLAVDNLLRLSYKWGVRNLIKAAKRGKLYRAKSTFCPHNTD